MSLPDQRTGPYDFGGLPVEPNSLLADRLMWEAQNPRPESIRRAERAIVRGLNAEGFGRQHQVTRHDRFDIAVDDLLIQVVQVERPS